MSKKYFAVTFLALVLVPSLQTSAMAAPKLRISLENTAKHFQTQFVRSFAESLREKAAGRLEVEFHFNAALFRDRDVPRAMYQGKVEMAVPGTWHLDRYEPLVGVFLLPAFYGRPAEDTHRLLAGPIGGEIARRLEERLSAKVLGGWLDLGQAHLYSVGKPIRTHADIHDLTIRVAGGLANEMRIRALGGWPVTIAWPDLPPKLQRRAVDGVLTTHATVASAELWKHGLSHAFEDCQYFPQYVPLVRRSFWNQLDDDLKKSMVDLWSGIVGPARLAAARSQEEARGKLLAQGITIVTPSRESLAEARGRIMPAQTSIAESLGLDRQFLARVMTELGRN